MAPPSGSEPLNPADEPALSWRPGASAGPHHFGERWAATPGITKWGAMALTALLSGVFAIPAAFYENSVAGVPALLLIVVLAPVVEETVKIAGIAYVAEERPWLVPRAFMLPLIGLVSGLVFAAVENWWYLVVLIPDPSADLVRWRWVFGPLVHGVGSFTAGLGVAAMWSRALRTGRQPSFGDVHPWLVAAAVWHGAYNLYAVLLELR